MPVASADNALIAVEAAYTSATSLFGWPKTSAMGCRTLAPVDVIRNSDILHPCVRERES